MGNNRLAPSGAETNEAVVSTVATVFREHHGELVRLALLMVGDLATAEDIVQDVYMSLHQRWSRGAEADSPLPYVRAAVLNGCRSVLRRGIARRAGLLHRASQPDKALASAESEAIVSEERREVRAALARLPGRRREVLCCVTTSACPRRRSRRSFASARGRSSPPPPGPWPHSPVI